MLKPALITGVVLTLAGVAAGCWPVENVMERSRKLVATRTYERRGPRVIVRAGAQRVTDASGQAMSVTMVLSADGYWVRSRDEYLTRELLRGTKILVVDRAWDTLGGRRTTTLLSRWIHEGGAVLMLGRGEGPDTRRRLGAGRIAVVDPTAFGTAELVEHLLDAIHWLD
ncbi:MAG: hypothetical protein ABIP90_04090 [Vicinamibacterales bacterium]